MIEIVELKAGYAGYNKQNILEVSKASFEVGKITGIVGLNGSGKSTLLKSIIGMTDITAGSVLLDGIPLQSFGHKSRAKLVSYLPQSFSAPAMDVYTLVSHGRFAHLGFSKILGQKDKDLIENALRFTDLWDIRDKQLSEISGGQRQRAYLAMVIAQNTRFLLLDEAASSLDIKHQLEVIKLLKKLADEGRGIVITSHDLPQCFSICHKIYLMNQGKIVTQGTPEEISSNKTLSSVMGIGLQKNNSQQYLYSYQLVK